MLPWNVPAKQWSEAKQRVLYSHPQAEIINQALDLLAKQVSDAYFKSRVSGVRLTDAAIREAIAPGSPAPRRSVDFKTFFAEFIRKRKAEGTYSPWTIKHYVNCFNRLREFEAFRGDEIHFDSIDLKYLEDFRLWLLKRNLAANSIAKHFRVLFTLLNYAKRKNIPVKTSFEGFSVRETASHHIYLSVSELDRLVAAKAGFGDRLRNAVDLFLIGCYTGLRYSDFSLLRLENIRNVQGVDMIFIRQQKTGDEVVIPVHPVVRAILAAGLPHRISGQKLNAYIKEACQLAGITDKIVHYYNQGGRMRSEVVEKWELVSSHTARRSCATNLHIAGVESRLIMRLTGHKKESTFNRYIRIDNEEAALLLSRTEFFK